HGVLGAALRVGGVYAGDGGGAAQVPSVLLLPLFLGLAHSTHLLSFFVSMGGEKKKIHAETVPRGFCVQSPPAGSFAARGRRKKVESVFWAAPPAQKTLLAKALPTISSEIEAGLSCGLSRKSGKPLFRNF